MHKGVIQKGAFYFFLTLLFILPLFLLISVLILLIPTSALPSTISGRFITSFYNWERQDDDSTSTQHLRAYQSAILHVSGIGTRDLLFHSYVYATSDLTEKASDDPRLKIYNLYLDWKRIARRVDVTLGRQRVYEGVGFGTIDGGRIGVKVGTKMVLTGYAGILTPLGKSNHLNTWSDGHLWGGRLTITGVGETDIVVSFVRRDRAPLRYRDPGRYNREIYEQNRLQVQDNGRQVQLVGLDLRRTVKRTMNLYGRLEINTQPLRVWEGEVVARYDVTKDVRVTGEFIHWAPQIAANSIFIVFDVQSNHQVALRGAYRLNRYVSLSTHLITVLYKGDTTQRVEFGASVGQGYIGYSRRIGYGGESDGLVASIRQPVGKRVWIRGDVSFSGYTLNEEVKERDDQIGGGIGVTYQPEKHVTFDIEGQGIRNTIYANDFRLFFRANYWFFSGKRGWEGGTW